MGSLLGFRFWWVYCGEIRNWKFDW